MKRKDSLMEAMLAGSPLPLPVIDIHAHLGRIDVFYMPSPDARGMVEEMDRLGVAMTASSSHSALSSDPVAGNDEMAQATRLFPGRLVGYAVANPHYGQGTVDELSRCFDELGMRLVKVHPGIHLYPLAGPAYEKVFRFAEERGAPVLTHTWTGDKHCDLPMCADLARRYASITWIWGHSGGSNFDDALRLAADLPNVYLDLASSLVFAGKLEFFIKNVPAEKIVFGSDMPFLSLPQQLANVVFADIPESAKRKILHENAARILESAGINPP